MQLASSCMHLASSAAARKLLPQNPKELSKALEGRRMFAVCPDDSLLNPQPPVAATHCSGAWHNVLYTNPIP